MIEKLKEGQRASVWIKFIASILTIASVVNAEEVPVELPNRNKETRGSDLAKWRPTASYENLGMQKKHELGGMSTPKEEIAVYPFNLGPTGILAIRNSEEMTYKVIEVDPTSPAADKIKAGDMIYGVGGRAFTEIEGPVASRERFPNPQMGMAIENAEASKSALLSLMVRREGKKMVVDIQLKPLGSFGKKFPHTSK